MPSVDAALGAPARGIPWGRLARQILLVVGDAAVVNVALLFGIWLRLAADEQIGSFFYYLGIYAHELLSFTLAAVVLNLVFNLYSSLWRYAGATEVAKIFLSASILFWGRFALDEIEAHDLLFRAATDARLPVAAYAVGLIVSFGGMSGLRLGYRALRRFRATVRLHIHPARPRTLIVGAGEAGSILLHALAERPDNAGTVVGLIDDDPLKRGLRLHGVRVEGNRHDLPAVCERLDVDRILVAVPSAKPDDLREILRLALSTGRDVLKAVPDDLLEVQSVHGVFSLQTSLRIGQIQPEDLLGREAVALDPRAAAEYLTGKTVLITGGAGSIGSELARQVAAFSPARLVVFDMNENDSHALSIEMKRNHPELDFTVVIGSVRDEAKLSATFARYRPHAVFHAAAHKHVPLMENDPEEAVKNNVLGTWQTALAASAHGVERFILVSTDKAVNPTNVMGASKRMCELIVKGLADTSERIRRISPDATATRYAAVRFGNVLGSNGSVVPLFKKQIEAGGPVTVTHPDMTRYFMTIPEAARLVIEAGALAENGEIFVLDMGEPVRIDSLARDMIRLAGLVPDRDIRIEYVGLRPGEKLYEELQTETEKTVPTHHPRIARLVDEGHPRERVDESLRDLSDTLHTSGNVRSALRRHVPTYAPAPDLDPDGDEGGEG